MAWLALLSLRLFSSRSRVSSTLQGWMDTAPMVLIPNNAAKSHRTDQIATIDLSRICWFARLVTASVFSFTLITICGCRSTRALPETVGNQTYAVDHITRQVERPSVQVHEAAYSSAPVTVRDRVGIEQQSYRDLSLDEVLQIAMRNSDILRELGGTVIRNPSSVLTRLRPGLNKNDPRFSPEAALAAFDAQLTASAFFSNNDQLYNNPFFAGGTNQFTQDLHEYNVELSKRTATGSQFSLRSSSIHNANNAPGNIFRSAWDTYVEGEVRQPLLQGAGLQFNRIAGPGATPGVYNGVLLAKVNNDLSETDFQVAIRNYINNVTNSYWDLYFAYRDLDARSRAMKRSLEAWNRIRARQESDLETGAAEALAREQYFRFKSEVDEALTGRVTQGTRSGNGSTGGTLEGVGGVQTSERRLRLLIGLPISDGQWIRPLDEPTEADIVFDWDTIRSEAMQRRAELRRQQLVVHKREMELLASKNFLNPRLDAVGRYRYRGFGDDLLRTQDGNSNTASAVGNLLGGGQQEWFLGVEYEMPLGYRRGHLAVQNAELMLSRERIVQREQQREIVHDLSNAVSDAARAYQACENSLNRYIAASELLASYEAQDDNNLDIDVDHLLDSQRRLVDAEIRYHRSRAEYGLALKNVHLEKGSLLQYHNLFIFEGRSAGQSGPIHENSGTPEPPIVDFDKQLDQAVQQ